MPSPKQILTQNGHPGSFKVIYFGVIEEPLQDYIAQYNNCGLRCDGSEDIAGKMSVMIVSPSDQPEHSSFYKYLVHHEILKGSPRARAIYKTGVGSGQSDLFLART